MQEGNISPIGKFLRNKWVWLTAAIDIIAIIVIVALYATKATATATISFNVAPVDATITINGSNDYKNNGQAYSIAPGTYEIQISHADLDTKTLTVNLEANHNTEIITFLSKDNGFYYYTLKDSMGSFYRLASIASADNNQTTDHDTSAETFIVDYQKQYKLYSTELPIDYTERIISEERGRGVAYSLTIRQASDKKPCTLYLCIEAFMSLTDDKSLVESKLREKGFKVEEYEIIYKIYN